MYLLTPRQAFVVGTIFPDYIPSQSNRNRDRQCGSQISCVPRAFEYGYPESYCQAMVDREMRFYLGEWIPLYDVNDKESKELKAKLPAAWDVPTRRPSPPPPTCS